MLYVSGTYSTILFVPVAYVPLIHVPYEFIINLDFLHLLSVNFLRLSYRYLLYQPVVDAQTEQLIGAEALLRWKSDAYGVVPPDQFIPLIEADPLFPELGEWIIREAVYAAKKILKKNPDFVININLSYTQLEKPDFVDMVFRSWTIRFI